MITNILDLRFAVNNDYSSVVEDAMNDQNLIFTGNSLRDIGFASYTEIEDAVQRARSVCTCSGLPVQQHFKTIFISDDDHHTVERDWKLSRLGFTLSILNGSPDNPLVARLQMAILNTYLAKESE
jgi:hypothetical protein